MHYSYNALLFLVATFWLLGVGPSYGQTCAAAGEPAVQAIVNDPAQCLGNCSISSRLDDPLECLGRSTPRRTG
jgi:hypothetical protein